MSGEKKPFYTPKNGKIWRRLKPAVRQLRSESTPTEDMLWARIRDRQVDGLKFRRQHAVDRFVVDFYCAEISLVIEVDGAIHHTTREQDILRQQTLECMGLHVLRFSNSDILNNIDSVIETIRKDQSL